MSGVVFDSFAVLAWVKEEPGAALVDDLLVRVRDGALWGAICSVNLGEVYYSLHRDQGAAQAEEAVRWLLSLDWDVLPATNELVWAAARLKASYAISYADAFALACAQQHDAALVTNDPELRAAPHGVELIWEPDETSQPE